MLTTTIYCFADTLDEQNIGEFKKPIKQANLLNSVLVLSIFSHFGQFLAVNMQLFFSYRTRVRNKKFMQNF